MENLLGSWLPEQLKDAFQAQPDDETTHNPNHGHRQHASRPPWKSLCPDGRIRRPGKARVACSGLTRIRIPVFAAGAYP
jgi:hypothetical protein